MRSHAFFLGLPVVVGVALGWGCGSKGVGFPEEGGTPGDEGGLPLDDGCIINCDPNLDGTTKTIDVNPKNVVLAIVNGNVPTQAFTATLDGQDVTAQVTWSFDQPIIGDVTNGLFTPSGKAAGVGTLQAKLSNANGSTTVTVTIDKTVNTGNLSQGQISALGSPNGGADPISFLYPSQDTYFPLAVLAPEMMWNGAQAQDVYRVRFTEKFLTYTEYVTAPPPSRHILPQADWDMIEYSGAGPTSDPLKMELTRMSGNTVFKPTVRTFHVAQGKLHGSVYYWELPDACQQYGNGRILRIKPGSTAVDQFFTNNGQCWGCHTVSRDGNTVMASFNFPVSTVDVSKNPAVKNGLDYGQGTFSAFNDKGDRALISADSFGQYAIKLVDIKTGNVLSASVFQAFGSAGEPAWSPDGKKVAAIGNMSGGGWTFDSSAGNLIVADHANGVFSNFKAIVPQNAGPGRPAYPSFDPTSGWLAYGRPTQGSRSTGQGDLWMTDVTGKTTKHLATTSSDNKTFNPVFAPLRSGGFSWIVFITRRDYGNRLVGTNRQQIWITAIDDPPVAADPSHMPFYMRGQEDCGKSENAYYALDPCKKKGENCESGVDCCSGQCIKDPNTKMYICGDPPANGCSGDGNACKVDGDCCDAPTSKCVDGFCQKPPPK